MAGKRKSNRRKSPRRSNSKKINLLNAAELYFQTSILTNSAFGTTPVEFFTGQEPFQHKTKGTVYGYMPISNKTRMTLPELFGKDSAIFGAVPFGGAGHATGGNAWSSMMSNVDDYGGLFVVAKNTLMVKVGFTVAKKLLSKQRTMINKGIKAVGLKGTVSV